MFIDKDPVDITMFQVMNEHSEIVNKKVMANFKNETLIEALKQMLFARTVDLQIVSYQRQGRMYTYPPNIGQEAIAVATGMNLTNVDWLTPAYREMAAWFAKGLSLNDIFMYWGGDENGSAMKNADKFLPISIPISSQLLHAVGIGFAIKYQKKKGIVVAFCGDGGTSEGDFHEAMNFASVWRVPVVFIIQNNGYAISCPITKQTGSKNITLKSIAYGMKGIQVDGNDFCASFTAVKEAADLARQDKGPILIEALTYRLGAHTTSDDPTRYRSAEEEKKWQPKDPVRRLRNYLATNSLWDKKEEEKLLAQYKKQVDTEFKKFEDSSPYKLEDCFKYLYDEMPDDLREQQVRYERYINWMEGGQ